MTLPRSPFKGLAYFGDSEHDWLLFFGRERESEVVAANLMASRLTVLYGPSGVGKSSLLRAGVARRLRALVPAVAGGDEAAEVVIVDSWRDDPVLAVAAAAGAPTDIPLADALAERAISSGAELYLMLDQMEEYILYHGREGGPLANALEDVLTRPGLPVHVLLGVRDDSLADLDALKRRLPGLFGNVLRLDHLTRAAARSAIEGPLRAYAELGGPEVVADDELVEAVLDEVATGRIEQHLSGRGLVEEGKRERRVEAPYLQLVLERLWEVERERGSDRLRAATLAELGGAERIVEQHLERALSGLDVSERDLVARLFNHLVTPSGTKIAHGIDDLARYADEDPAGLEPVLAALDSARIVRRVPGRAGGPARYEIFHDVLAPAVLAWRAGHESGRALEQEREAARRRHRRVALLATAALVALAGTLALALWALSQRSEAREKAIAAERGALAAKARELEANAILQLGRDPELGLALAAHAARLAPAAATETVLRRALRESRVRTLARLDSPVSDLVVLPDGRVAAVVDGGGVRLVDGDTAGPFVVPPRSGARSWFSGEHVLTLRDGTLTARTLPDGEAVVTMRVPDGHALRGRRNRAEPVRRRGAARGGRLQSCRSPDRRSRSPGGREPRCIQPERPPDRDGRLGRRRDRVGRRRAPVRTFDGPPGRAYDVAFDHLSRTLVVASSDGAARVWAPSGHREAVLSLHGNQVRRARFGDNQDLVLTASRDWHCTDVEGGDERAAGGLRGARRPRRGRDLPSGRPARDRRRGRNGAYVGDAAAAVPAPRAWDARARADARPARDDRRHGRAARQRRHAPWAPRRRPLGRVLARRPRVVTASMDGDARIWNARTGSLQVLSGHGGTVFDASFSPDGTWVVTGGPATAGLWLAATGELWYFLRGDGTPVRAAAFVSPSRIVTLGGDGVRSYFCEFCGGLGSLVALAEKRLEGTGRELTQGERLTYLGER